VTWAKCAALIETFSSPDKTMIALRPALSADYTFALDLYVQTIKPLATGLSR
jgi:hypothetical protein